VGSTLNGEQFPGPRDALELVLTSVLELDARAGHEVGDGARDEDLVGSRLCLDSCCEMYCDPTDIVISQLDLAGVKPCSNLQTERTQRVAQPNSAPDSPSRPVEGCQHPIAGRFHQLAALPFDVLEADAIVLVEQPSPAGVAEFSRPCRRVNDVSEEHSRQDALKRGRPSSAGQELFDLVDNRVGVATTQKKSSEPASSTSLAPGMCSAR